MNNKDDWLLKRPIAHRGVHENPSVPENSLRSFELAVEQGHPIELDVHMTKDEKFVVFHDDDLSRVCNQSKMISELDLCELEEIQLFDSDQKIPGLKRVLEYVDGRVPLLIEVKDKSISTDKVAMRLTELIDKKENIAIMSFNPILLLKIQKVCPGVDLVLAYTHLLDPSLSLWKKLVLKSQFLTLFLNLQALAVDHKTISSWRWNLLKKIKSPKVSWTIKEDSNLSNLKGRVSNIIFEDYTNKNNQKWMEMINE